MLFMKLLLICLFVATSLVSKASLIDSDFTDWNGVAPISIGFLSANPQNTAGVVNPISAVYMKSDDVYLYLSVLCSGPIKPGAWSPTMVAIDADLDPTTGFPCRQLGVDYFIQPSNKMDGSVMIHRRQAGANSPEWSRWHAPVIIAQGYRICSGDAGCRAEMRIPWKQIGVDHPAQASLRFVVCDSSELLNPSRGSWCPAVKQAYFSFGDDPKRMDKMPNLVSNGQFEQLQKAAARALPQDWHESVEGPSAVVDVSSDAYEGKNAVRLKATAPDHCSILSDVVPISHGLLKYRYKLLSKADGDGNLGIHVMGMGAEDGAELTRSTMQPNPEHAADGQWHEMSMEFDYSSKGVKYCRIEAFVLGKPDASGTSEWLIDSVEMYAVTTGVQLRIGNTWVEKPYLRQGDDTKLCVWLENNGDSDAQNVEVSVAAGDGFKSITPTQQKVTIPIGEYRKLTWSLKAITPGEHTVSVTTHMGDSDPLSATYRILVLEKGRRYTRQQLCTDEQGYWRLLPKPAQLQSGNRQPVKAITHKSSSQIGRNTYGICTQLPRAKDYEDPYNVTHLIDADPDSCWSSQNNSTPYPGRAPWVVIELPKIQPIKQVNLIPYWENTDFPQGFTIFASVDGKQWTTCVVVNNYAIREGLDRRGDKVVQAFPFSDAVQAKYVKVTFDRLPLSGGNYAEVSQGYKARLSGIELISSTGQNLAVVKSGAKVTASDVFTAWQNTAKTVNESFDAIMKIGLKWVRVGQWGDQTEWAAVERIKGQYQMDPVTDKAINELVRNRISILYGLNYGNALYNDTDKPWGDMGPVYKEGHPFYLNNGPRTDEQRTAFVKYVDWVIRKYGDRITWWELWNEQNGWFPGHEPTLYGKLLTAVAKHIKAVNPNLKVMYGGTAAPAPREVEISLREGAAPYVDAYAFHPYGIDKPEGGMGTLDMDRDVNLSQTREQTGWNHLEEIIAGVKKPFAEHGNPNIEVWQNEFGTNVTGKEFAYNPGIGEYGCAKYLTRFYLYGGWLKAPTAWWALYNMNHSQDWGIIEQDGYGFRPMSYALQNVCSVVSDVEPIYNLDFKYKGESTDPKVIGYQCDHSKRKLVALWSADATSDKLITYPSQLSVKLDKSPSRVTITDLYWGISQPAKWSYSDGHVILDSLIVHDYPIVLSID
ncbi:MAG: discoidin domain-containing protein [Armatimonadota bacterium]